MDYPSLIDINESLYISYVLQILLPMSFTYSFAELKLYIVKYETFFPLWFPSILSCKAFSTTELHNSISFCYFSNLKSPSLTLSLVFHVKVQQQGLCNIPISGTRGQERCCLELQACAEHYYANIKWLIKSL